jgi:hypothetical protein
VEDANVVKPTVPPGSKSGTPATEPRVEDGIGPDATQGAAKLETPAAPGLGAAVSDTSTDNVPEGSQSAALRALIEEMRAATSGDINAAIPKSLAKRALDAGLIKQRRYGYGPYSSCGNERCGRRVRCSTRCRTNYGGSPCRRGIGVTKGSDEFDRRSPCRRGI